MKILLSLVLSGVAVIALSGCGGSDDTTNSGTANSGTTNSGTANSGTTNSGTTTSGTANSGTTTSGTANSGTITSGFTLDLLVGKTYVVIDGDEEETISFTETEMSYTGNGSTGTGTYTIDANGILIVDTPEGQAILTLTDKEDSTNLSVDNNGVPTVWVLIS